MGRIKGRMPRRARRGAQALCALLTALLALFATPVLAQSSGAEARVVIVRPLQLTYVDDLEFGAVAEYGSGGTVIVDPDDDSCAVTGSLVQAGTCTAAHFAGMGARNMILRIRVKDSSIRLTGPGAYMTVNNFTLDYDPDLDFLRRQGQFNVARITSPTGIFTFRVGGTLTVNARQAPGTYTGEFDVQVQYQ